MNLQENIHRIQSMMGVITEDDNTAKIDKMMNDIGLSNTIKFLGGYDSFKKLYGGDISNEDKINFINQSVKDKTEQEGTPHIYVSKTYYLYNDNDITKTIDYLYVGFLKVNYYLNVNNKYQYTHTATIQYDELSNEELNKVFKAVLDIV